ncbi:hypothetical protein JCM21714_1487 [Gracilibacillus boraciitolerans JCM 21714]|uniref:DNA-directed RNA polymerase subunit beta n=1 Tax=Gracilibacillus boraciitolerans JCM 21714 TaxID=1298598 RepID=W4VI48_9BACI|nr:DNA-directed RNA polymerase subunit beta [Gracilibacillus boraciitolerans]GAE92483.1 hypothetical protein JCM21714_1487 [Gracilibacillus boraciitolerans JCM 21714]
MSKETRSKKPNKQQTDEQKQITDNTQSKKEKRAEKKKQNKEEKKYLRRVVPVWLKILIVVVLSLFALMIGLIIGFSTLGDGRPLDVLRWDTWQHIIDFVRTE